MRLRFYRFDSLVYANIVTHTQFKPNHPRPDQPVSSRLLFLVPHFSTKPTPSPEPTARGDGAPGMEGGGGVDAAGGGVHTWRLAHVCAFAFLLHLKPSEPHIGAPPSQPTNPRAVPTERDDDDVRPVRR